MKTILLLEDDESLNRGITLKLCREGYHVLSASTIREADDFFNNESIEMIISDISLPDGNGLDFGKKVRRKSNVYLIYLTVLDQEIDIINGYDTGADDYITKPFSVSTLVAKVNALMRRLSEKEVTEYISGKLQVVLKDMQVLVESNNIPLSRTEIQLLIYLLENAGQIVSKESILDKVWGIDGKFVDDNTVPVNISRLKNKLGVDMISNVRGLGYIWTGEVIKK